MAAPNFLIHENFNPLTVIVPANYSGAASTDLAISLKKAHAVAFYLTTGAWAGGTAAVTLLQGTAGAGTATLTGSKALAFSSVWTKTLTDDTPTKVAVVSNTFNLDTANKTYIVEVPAASLDISNGFCTIALHVATPGSNADYYVCVAIVTPRIAAASPLTTLVD